MLLSFNFHSKIIITNFHFDVIFKASKNLFIPLTNYNLGSILTLKVIYTLQGMAFLEF